jgi:Flp pilus assembly protein TadB
MTATTIILIAILCICLIALGLVFTFLFKPEPDPRLATLTRSGNRPGNDEMLKKVERARSRQSISSIEIEDVQRKLGETRISAKNLDSEEVKLFRAGFLTKDQRDSYARTKKISFIISPILSFLLLYAIGGIKFGVLGIVIGILCGYLFPQAKLDRLIRKRDDECMYYLPLVIEQISIGVSSALDIGPCVTYVVEMANERGSHNAITELLTQVLKLMKAGMSLEEALNDVGEVVGVNEVKNAFMFLGQCAKHGGEISRQLQELSESVTLARQMIIETKITALPTKATGALALVFIGFFGMLLAGLLVRLSEGMS